MQLNVELVFTFISLIFFLYYFSSRCNGFSVGGLSGTDQIFVKTFDGRTVTLNDFEDNSTVQTIFDKLKDLNIYPTLDYEITRLKKKDNTTLNDYNILLKDIINHEQTLILHIAGGPRPIFTKLN